MICERCLPTERALARSSDPEKLSGDGFDSEALELECFNHLVYSPPNEN